MKKTLTILSVAFLVITSCNNSSTSPSSYQSSSSGNESVERPKTPEELRAELKIQEENNPTSYLSADGTYKENFWGDKFKVSCTVTNKATIATFKDAVIRVTYYSKSKTVLGEKDYTIYEIFPANTSKTIEMKIDNYKDVNSIGWDVISAVSVE